MATKLTANNLLYLYGLLTREFGVGTQAFLPRVEEAFAADGIDPIALEYTDAADLLASLDFVTLTAFKGGRVYATVVRRDDFDEALAAAGEQEEAKPAKKGGKPWKRKKAALRPVKPQPRPQKAGKKAAQASADAGAAAAGAASEQAAEKTPEPAAGAADAQKADAATEPAPAATEPAPAVAQEPEGDTAPSGTDAAAAVTDAEPRETAAPDQESGNAVPTEAPAAAAVDDDWYDEPEPDYSVAKTLAEILAESRAQEAARAEREAARAATAADQAAAEAPVATAQGEATPAEGTTAPAPEPLRAPRRDYLPQDFWMEVHCPDELAAALARVLPIDADFHTTVQEDWQVALSTGTLEATRSHAEFPLRYLREDGSPITISLNRRSRVRTGKRWEVVAVDGDTTGEQHEGADAEGAAVALEGAWARLSAVRLPAYRRVSPLRQVSETFVFPSWENVCDDLLRITPAEPWGTQDEPYRVLREYLCVTFAAAVSQDKLSVCPDGSFAAWHTGLRTGNYQPVYACLTPGNGTTPWRLSGFSVAGAGGTCARLNTPGFEPPAPATYLVSLDDVRLAPDAPVEVDDALTPLASTIGTAVAHARADWRHAAPVWDPQDQRTKLLLPLEGTGDPQSADAADSSPCAAVERAVLLEHAGDTYRATATLGLADAYTCARVVSPTLPAWLDPAAAGLVLPVAAG